MKRIVFFAGLVCAACGPAPAPVTQSNLTVPYQPTKAEVAAIQKAVTDKLKDPGSAQFGLMTAGKTVTGGIVACGYVNAKNSFGGYVGMSPYIAESISVKPPVFSGGPLSGQGALFVLRAECAKYGLRI